MVTPLWPKDALVLGAHHAIAFDDLMRSPVDDMFDRVGDSIRKLSQMGDIICWEMIAGPSYWYDAAKNEWVTDGNA